MGNEAHSDANRSSTTHLYCASATLPQALAAGVVRMSCELTATRVESQCGIFTGIRPVFGGF